MMCGVCGSTTTAIWITDSKWILDEFATSAAFVETGSEGLAKPEASHQSQIAGATTAGHFREPFLKVGAFVQRNELPTLDVFDSSWLARLGVDSGITRT
mmetsp:Transcript_26346/g.87314  ORF Transcript_26346/g.87314 Transcript_26346/m.87314 type:complete len:99 (+) Transcript_26346:1785-2081(+)